MVSDPNSLRRAADQAKLDRAVEAQQRKQRAAAEFPALFARFVSSLEQCVQVSSQSGCDSAVVLSLSCGPCCGDRASVPGPRHTSVTPAVRAALGAANEVLAEISELNGGSHNNDPRSYPSFWPSDAPLVIGNYEFLRKVAAHFTGLGFSADQTSDYYGGSPRNVEVSWK